MSVKHRALRVLFMVPAVVIAASWVAVRSMAAGPTLGLDEDPPLAVATAAAEIPDPALGELIARFAAEARARR
jgi:hypothetical protein